MNENFADFHFVFNENGVRKWIPAHKAILATLSDVFAIMLNEQWNEKNEAEITATSSSVFTEFLQFFYLSQVKVSAENILEVIHLANMYNMPKCVELCVEHIKENLTIEDVCAVLDTALQLDLIKLKDHCLTKIGQGTTRVLSTEGFIRCSKAALKSIMSLDMVDVDCEEIVLFNASLNWAKHACDVNKIDPTNNANVRAALSEALHEIRFATMKPSEVAQCVTENEGLFQTHELEDLFFAIGSNKSQAKVFKKTPRKIYSKPWEESKQVKCNLVSGDSISHTLTGIESTSFEISKSLLFGGIELGEIMEVEIVDDNVYTRRYDIIPARFTLKILSNQQHTILQQTIQSDALNSFFKFERPLPLRPNTEYEVRIEIAMGTIEMVCHYSSKKGHNEQKRIAGDIILRTKGQCSPLIRSLWFNQ